MERHCDEHGSRRYVSCQVGHAKARQRRRQGAPALVLEAVDRFLDRSIGGCGRPNTPQRAQPVTAAAVCAGEFPLAPTVRAQRLLEEPYAGMTAIAEP